MTTMPLDQLRLADRHFKNPRLSSGLDPESLHELALGIGRSGLLNRILVQPDGLIIAGQRRFRALQLLQRWQTELVGDLEDYELPVFEARAETYRTDVPVEILHGSFLPGQLEGIALADNIGRKDLSSYEIAAHIAEMGRLSLGAQIAKLVGKSPAWVSRHLAAWRGASPATHEAWAANRLTFDQVLFLASLSHEAQARELATGQPRGVRGPTNRPGIDAVKAALATVRTKNKGRADLKPVAEGYLAGVLDVLRWVAEGEERPLLKELVGDGE